MQRLALLAIPLLVVSTPALSADLAGRCTGSVTW